MRSFPVGGLFHLRRVLVAMPLLLKAFSCTKKNPGTFRHPYCANSSLLESILRHDDV